MHTPVRNLFRRLSTTIKTTFNPKFCIVGSGPAGFYTAQGLLRSFPNASVDIYEKLPIPFGLLRYGVAPIHPDVKNVINSFAAIVQKECCTFNGNIAVGRDITLEQLQNSYHAVVISNGAYNDKRFGVPGEDLSSVISARSFVGWYNGLPEHSKLNVNLDVETVAILGHGNVALDVARMLLTNIDILKKTDITEYALQTLGQSRVKRVVIVGRRGPLQAAFTIKEFRDMFSIDGCKGFIKKSDFVNINKDVLEAMLRPRRRLTDLMMEKSTSLANDLHSDLKSWEMFFLRSPVEFLASPSTNSLAGIRLNVNVLKEVDGIPRAVPTGAVETLECGLAFRSIGYITRPIESTLPMNTKKGIVDNVHGRVQGNPGLYCSGWASSGPIGVILSTMSDSFKLCEIILDDSKCGRLDFSKNKEGRASIMNLLRAKNIQVVSFEDWLKIDREERSRGAKVGKPREKISDIGDMLAIASKFELLFATKPTQGVVLAVGCTQCGAKKRETKE